MKEIRSNKKPTFIVLTILQHYTTDIIASCQRKLMKLFVFCTINNYITVSLLITAYHQRIITLFAFPQLFSLFFLEYILHKVTIIIYTYIAEYTEKIVENLCQFYKILS